MEAKKRGQRHHYNKTRYQNKAKVVSKVVSEKEVTNKNKDNVKEPADNEKGLTSNWDRYKEEDDEDKIDDSTNFALLAQAPISHGGHFQFKSDKNVESEFDFESLRKNKMFALDLQLLEHSLSSIPFLERSGLEESYFTESQLEEMNKRSSQNKAYYESYLKINSVTKEFLTQRISESESNESSEEDKNEDVHDDIENLLTTEVQPDSTKEIKNKNVKEEMQDLAANVKTEKVSSTNDLKQDKEVLEQWLDDILND